jgi:hypothetical protein
MENEPQHPIPPLAPYEIDVDLAHAFRKFTVEELKLVKQHLTVRKEEKNEQTSNRLTDQ